jgi:hypothetical protein
MAALVLLAGTTVVLCLDAKTQTVHRAAEDKSATRSHEKTPAKVVEKRPEASPASTKPVELNLMIAGLGKDGCEVEVRPGSRSCRFKPQEQHVNSVGKASFVLKDVELRGADRNCTFAITVREPGQAPKTIYRGFRLSTKPDSPRTASASHSFTCFMNSPSRLAGLDRPDQTRQ